VSSKLLFPTPTKLDLPLSKGNDLLVNFRNNPSGDGVTFTDWGVGVTVTLVVDGATPVNAVASISGAVASVRVDSSTCDLVKNGVLWRLLVDTPGTPDTQTVAANGKVVRADGN
jgi:hypothetical protein